MKRETQRTAWPQHGLGGAAAAATRDRVPVAQQRVPSASDTQPVGWIAMRLLAAVRAARRVLASRRTADSAAVLPSHLLQDVGLSAAWHAAERAHVESQVERFARASAQLGGASERFGPW
jgi:hypothetical protein